MTCTCSCLSPFRWRERTEGSIFTEKAFTGTAATGKTASQIASATTDRITRETGRSPGSIFGISDAADRCAEESQRKRRAAK